MITLHKGVLLKGEFASFQKQILTDFNDNNKTRAAGFVLISILDNKQEFYDKYKFSIEKLLKKLNLTEGEWKKSIQKILIAKGYLKFSKTHIKATGVWLHKYDFYDKSQLAEVPKLEKRKRKKKEEPAESTQEHETEKKINIMVDDSNVKTVKLEELNIQLGAGYNEDVELPF